MSEPAIKIGSRVRYEKYPQPFTVSRIFRNHAYLDGIAWAVPLYQLTLADEPSAPAPEQAVSSENPVSIAEMCAAIQHLRVVVAGWQSGTAYDKDCEQIDAAIVTLRRTEALERQLVKAMEALDEIQDYVEAGLSAKNIHEAIRKARIDVLAAAEGRQE